MEDVEADIIGASDFIDMDDLIEAVQLKHDIETNPSIG